jgi:hypothetical protein
LFAQSIALARSETIKKNKNDKLNEAKGLVA